MRTGFKKAVSVALCVLCAAVGIPSAAAADNVDTLLSKMTTEEKIAQMITVAVRQWDGEDFTVMEDDVANIISKTSVGGVILFAENLVDTEQSVKLTTAFQQAALASRNKIPLFISTDQEGGEVVRLNTGTSLPGNMALGAINSANDAKTAGNILGSELAALGINMDFAPSLDVNSNPSNPIIGLRSFSSDPAIVSALGIQVINGIQQNNVAAAAKHFPGHGDTSTDSHTSLPSVDKSLDQLEKCEFLPFKAAIDNGVDVIMTAHIQFPQVEKKTVRSESDGSNVTLPATLSKTFVTDILRNKLGFKGVVTTDAMNMGAIADNFGVAQACILAINAGVDNLLMPISLTDKSSGTELKGLIGNIKSAVVNGNIKEETIDNAVKRILQLKGKRGVLNYTAPTAENAKKIVGSAENHEKEDDLATKAVTVLKNEGNVLPFKPTENQNIVLVAAYENETPGMEYAMSKIISQKTIPNVNYETCYYNDGSSAEEILNTVSGADYVIVLSEMNSNEDIAQGSLNTYVPTSVMNYCKENNIKCVVVSVGKPYDTANYKDAQALMAAYGCNGMNPEDTDGSQPATYTYGPNILAAVEVAFGYKNPYGTLPVDIPAVLSDGSMYEANLVFKKGDGLLFAGTVRPAEAATQPATAEAEKATALPSSSDPVNSFMNTLQNSGYFLIVACLLAAALVVIIIIIAVAVKGGKKKSNKKIR